MGKSRLWCFTNFNLDFDYDSLLTTSSAVYIFCGRETSPTSNRLHDQGLIYFSGQRGSIKGVAKDLGNCHVQICKGNLDQNLDYCSKDGDFREFGIKPSQGKRADLISIKDLIMSGEKSVDQICESTPEIFHQYGRTLNKLEDIHFRSKFRNFMTIGLWIYGPTGCGKSHTAYQGFDPKTHYVYRRS